MSLNKRKSRNSRLVDVLAKLVLILGFKILQYILQEEFLHAPL